MSIHSPSLERTGVFDALLKPTSTWAFTAQSSAPTVSVAVSASLFIPTVTSKATKLSHVNAVPTVAEIVAALSEVESTSASGLSASPALGVSIARLSLSICEHVVMTSKTIIDPRIVASLLVAISYCADDVAPSPVRTGANDAISLTSPTSHLRTSSTSSTANVTSGTVLSPSSSTASSLFKDEQRSLFLSKDLPEAIRAIETVFVMSQKQANALSVTATSDLIFNLFLSRKHVGGISKQSVVIGGVIGGGGGEDERGADKDKNSIKNKVVIESSNSSIIIEDCQDTAIFVTVSVTMLCLRRLKRCTIVCVPSSIVLNVEDCSHSIVSGCARSVTIKNCTEVKLFTLMSQLSYSRENSQTSSSDGRAVCIPVFGDSREVVIGPYNVCAPGVISSTPLASWASTGTAATDADKLAANETSAVRNMQRHEYYLRYLPTASVSESTPLYAVAKDGHGSTTSNSNESKATDAQKMERIDPERFFVDDKKASSSTASTSSTKGINAEEEERERLQIESDLASLDVPTAQRAELLLQSSFVTWLLEDNKASGLKNSLR